MPLPSQHSSISDIFPFVNSSGGSSRLVRVCVGMGAPCWASWVLSRPGARRLRERGLSHGSAIEVSRAQLYCHVQKIHVIHEAETVRHTDRRFGRRLKFHSRKTLITAPRDPNVSVDLYLTRGSITSQVIKRMVLCPSLFHIVTSQEICTDDTILSEQRLSHNRPSYRNSPQTVPDSTSYPWSVSGKNHGAPCIIDQSIFVTSVSS